MKPILRRILPLSFDALVLFCAVHTLAHIEHFQAGWFAVGLAAVFVPLVVARSTPAVLGCSLGTYFTLVFAHSEGAESVGAAYAALCVAIYAVGPVEFIAKAVTKRRSKRPKLVSLSGFARSGKDTAAAALVEDGWHRIAFADKLKAVAYDTNPWVNTNTAHMIRLRNLVDACGWEQAKEHDDVRQFLQDLGLAARNHLGGDVWLDAALAEMPADKNIIITDARFPNELAAVRARDGLLVRIDRPGVVAANQHVSESGWNEEKFHVVVHNKSSVEVLQAATRYVAGHARPRRANPRRES